MSNEAIKNAMQLIEQGHIEQGGPILIDLLEYKRPEDAWAWLYLCVKTDEQRIYCLRRILQLNPSHQKAQKDLVELKLREAKASVLSDALNPRANEAKHQIGGEVAVIQSEHREVVENNQSVSLATPEQDLSNEYKQESLPGFVQLESHPTGNHRSDAVIQHKKKPNHKRKPKHKSTEKSSEEDLKEASKPKEPHVFNPKIYRVVRTKADKNMFAERKSYSGLPETDSGMYGRRLLLGGIPITSFDHPQCIDRGHIPRKSECHNCEFFAILDCPIRRDPLILKDAVTLFAQNKRYSQEYEEKRQRIIETIFTELKEHGRPLHYEVFAKILHDRYPELKLNPWKILRIMGWHSNKFEWVDVGVYRAK